VIILQGLIMAGKLILIGMIMKHILMMKNIEGCDLYDSFKSIQSN